MPHYIVSDFKALAIALLLILILAVLEFKMSRLHNRSLAKRVFRPLLILAGIGSLFALFFALIDFVPFYIHGTIWSYNLRMKLLLAKIISGMVEVIGYVVALGIIKRHIAES